MSPLTYAELIHELFPRLSGGIQWGTERTERLLAQLGEPHRRYRVLHVGGTNGKGSLAAMLESVLRAAGVRTGLYTSPHLCAFRERVQVAGAPLPDEALLAAAERVLPLARAEAATFFEATTALALHAFATAGVDTAVIEVGLGGRLDATNVVRPDVVALTNVSLDHTDMLGETIEAVAAEKAGIIKADVPVVTAEQDARLLAIFRAAARAAGARLLVLEPAEVHDVRVALDGTRFRLAALGSAELELHVPLIGAHQARNAALAARVLEQLPEPARPSSRALLRGLAQLHWPGRFQVERARGCTWILDAAHNAASSAALVETLTQVQVPEPLVLVAAILKDKDWRAILPPLLARAAAGVLTVAPSMPEERRWEPWSVAAELERAVEVIPDFAAALAAAAQRAAGGTVLVTGSFHTAGDALIALGRAPFGADTPLPLVPRAV